MRIDKIEDFQGGWFIGNFDPSILKTELFEISYKVHKQGEFWPKHYHKIATEYNCLMKGKMIIGEIELNSGDIFTIFPGEIADPVFLEECRLIVCKVPSVKNDKYEI